MRLSFSNSLSTESFLPTCNIFNVQRWFFVLFFTPMEIDSKIQDDSDSANDSDSSMTKNVADLDRVSEDETTDLNPATSKKSSKNTVKKTQSLFHFCRLFFQFLSFFVIGVFQKLSEIVYWTGKNAKKLKTVKMKKNNIKTVMLILQVQVITKFERSRKEKD